MAVHHRPKTCGTTDVLHRVLRAVAICEGQVFGNTKHKEVLPNSHSHFQVLSYVHLIISRHVLGSWSVRISPDTSAFCQISLYLSHSRHMPVQCLDYTVDTYFQIFSILLQRPDGLWGPPSILFYKYRRSFLEVKRARRDVTHSPPSSVEVKNESCYTVLHCATLCSPHTSSQRRQGQLRFLPTTSHRTVGATLAHSQRRKRRPQKSHYTKYNENQARTCQLKQAEQSEWAIFVSDAKNTFRLSITILALPPTPA